MGTITKLGLWLDKRFPAKISVDEVHSAITSTKIEAEKALANSISAIAHAQELQARIANLEKLIEKMTGELAAAKTFIGIKSRIASSAPANERVPQAIAR